MRAQGDPLKGRPRTAITFLGAVADASAVVGQGEKFLSRGASALSVARKWPDALNKKIRVGATVTPSCHKANTSFAA